MKKKILLGAIFSIFMIVSFGQDLPIIEIINNTGYDVYYLHMSQTASDNWEDDELGDDILYDGESTYIRLPYPLDVTNTYDIKLEDDEGDTYTKWDVTISANSAIEFTIADLDVDSDYDYYDTSSSEDYPEIEITNNTGYTIYYVYVSPTDSDWGDDVLDDDILLDGESVYVTLPYSIDYENEYDIKLEDSEGDTYTRWAVDVSPYDEIEFTIDDLDLGSDFYDILYTYPEIEITNNTGYTIWYVYVSETDRDSWGEDILEDDVLLDGESVYVSLPYSLEIVDEYDIKVEDDEGDTYTKWNVEISPYDEVEFTLDDIDY